LKTALAIVKTPHCLQLEVTES